MDATVSAWETYLWMLVIKMHLCALSCCTKISKAFKTA
jgi:hypothetical protein